jgi:hypothetical protein
MACGFALRAAADDLRFLIAVECLPNHRIVSHWPEGD